MLRTALCLSFVLSALIVACCQAETPPESKFSLQLEFDGKLCKASFAKMEASAQNVEVKAGTGAKNVIYMSGRVQIQSGDFRFSADHATFDLSSSTLSLNSKEGRKVQMRTEKTFTEAKLITFRPKSKELRIDNASTVSSSSGASPLLDALNELDRDNR